jgi:hypothetical protein
MITMAAKESAKVAMALGNLMESHVPVQGPEKITGNILYEADVIVQLKANLALLEDLHGRMHFMMGELSYLLKRS